METNSQPQSAPVTPSSEPGAPKPPADPAKTAEWPGGFAALRQSFEQIKKNPQPAYVVVAVFALLSLVAFGAKSSLGSQGSSNVTGLANLIFLLALPTYALAIADRRPISVSQFFAFNFSKYLSLLGASILFFLIIVASVFLLVVPVVWTLPWFILFSYFIVERGIGPIDALKASKDLTKNHLGKVWGLFGATIVIGIVAGLLSLIPVVGGAAEGAVQVIATGALALLYRWLQQHGGLLAEGTPVGGVVGNIAKASAPQAQPNPAAPPAPAGQPPVSPETPAPNDPQNPFAVK
jgi:hypothetical protein